MMYASTDNFTPTRSILMRILIRPREYRHPRFWVGLRSACGIFNLLLGVVVLAAAHWLGYWTLLGLIPLAGAVLIFATVRHLQHSVQS